MMDDLGTSLAEIVRNREAYGYNETTYDEGCSHETEVPFHLLSGETPQHLGLYSNKAHFLVLTNYRIFVTREEGCHSIPLGLVEGVEHRHPMDLVLLCKDGKLIRLPLDSLSQAKQWSHRIHKAIQPPQHFRDTFAFVHYAYLSDTSMSFSTMLSAADNSHLTSNNSYLTGLVTSEYQRMGLQASGLWRITESNTKFQLCASYPKLFVVPCSVNDKDLEQIAKFRSLGRVPAVVWRHSNGCILARASQPLTGVLGWRCQQDEKLLLALSQACRPVVAEGVEPVSNGHIPSDAPSLLVLDLRSYTAALANRAKGGGCEHADYYSNCDVQYKGLANIHSVRSSFFMLRNLLASEDKTNFLSSLESSQWLHYLSQLLSCSVEVVMAINDRGHPVMVHCSDGWDRTSQIVALAELLLDPFYRTVKGFQVLIEREWISFGHKFADRNGFGADGEQSCIFLQWLDCVHQLVKQFPTDFEFNLLFLVKLAQHCYSQLYGTFLTNCKQEREEENIEPHTLSIWHLLNTANKSVVNPLFVPNSDVLYPSCHIQRMLLWNELFMASPLIPYSSEYSPLVSPAPPTFLTTLTSPATDDAHSRHPQVNGHAHDEEPPSEKDSHQSNGFSIDEPTSNGHCTAEGDTPNDHITNGDTVEGQAPNDHTAIVDDHGTPGTNGHVEPTNGHGASTSNEPLNDAIEDSLVPVRDASLEPVAVNVEPSSDPESADSERDNLVRYNPVVMATVGEPSSDLLANSPGTSNRICLDNMEESFRIIEETSLAGTHIPPPNGHAFTAPTVNRMAYSVYSECDSRLRNLGGDGLGCLNDPVQDRVREMERQYQERIRELEGKVQKLTWSIRHQRYSGGCDSVNESGVSDDTEVATDKCSSPVNGWTYVDETESRCVQWEPDHAVTHCRLCGAEFWMGRRKHHCRNCGGVFCWKCSNYFSPVPREGLYADQRVCRRCFDKLDGFLKRGES